MQVICQSLPRHGGVSHEKIIWPRVFAVPPFFLDHPQARLSGQPPTREKRPHWEQADFLESRITSGGDSRNFPQRDAVTTFEGQLITGEFQKRKEFEVDTLIPGRKSGNLVFKVTAYSLS